MKNIYSILSLSLVLISVSVFGQSKIYAPNLRSPENMEIDQMPNVLLDWDAVTGVSPVILYELQLDDNMDFTNPFTFNPTDLTALSMSGLLFGGDYFWRVRAYDGNEVSNWSEAWGFTVLWNVTMDKPNDNSEVFANPEVSWDAITGIDGYLMQLDTVYEWTNANSGVTENLNASSVDVNGDMWAVGDNGTVLYNDGNGWSSIDVGTSEDLNAICFLDASNGYIVGNGGTVLLFDGASWTQADPGTTSDLTGVSFADSDNGAIVGSNGTVVVYSSGVWTEAETGDDNDLRSVSMLDVSSIWACGEGKIVVSFDGNEWSSEVVGTKDHYGISMLNSNTGWTVGKSGKIYMWDGSEWTEENSGTSKDLYSVSFNGMEGYAVGKSGTMVKYSGSWNPVTSGLSELLSCVFVSDEGGLVVGEDGVMLNRSNSGFNSPYLQNIGISSDSSELNLTNLLFGSTYYYRIKAFHDMDTSMWSGVKSFTTYPSPTLDKPSNGDETDLMVKFSWDEYEGTTNYIFQIDIDEDFTMPRSYAPGSDTLWVSDLIFGEEYYWRVSAQHAQDISDWSEVWTVNTVNSIVLTSPENSSEEVNRCPLFTWEEVVGTSGYELWYDSDAAFSNPTKYVGEDPKYQCQLNLDQSTVYYWKVKGKSGALMSDWSETWSFTTEQGIGVQETIDVESVSLYPNPSNGNFSLNIIANESSSYSIRVIDISGKVVYDNIIDLKTGNNSTNIVIDNISSGSYNLVISDKDYNISKRLLIK
ncbi:MAG: T9SS type A sorting domain-containing protein [Bacteroidales bacterium]|jgi:photosystem II stability/assembly factor-like uncharacterized protein|nr:T9SS type A sorting domain-containing protein [Bacteroidales bacterium]MDG1902626.1 T9SS type A sorting domain-containing protein [Bacteroidales bacterium]MDG2081010.1 T9SS type A sorting domain-containing protein [Bacteroidales bacterium]|tara:strand:- start:4681 stop:6945 length:2265 start_codon:yes stop_codon:yes gene_type:complete